MSGFKAVLLGATLAVLTAASLLAFAMIAGVIQFTGPQMLTTSALWIGSGYYAATKSGEAGILHGLLAGLAGALITAGLLSLLHVFAPTPFIENLVSRGPVLLGVIGGFWGAIGGMFYDVVRGVKAKRARKRRVAMEGSGNAGDAG